MIAVEAGVREDLVLAQNGVLDVVDLDVLTGILADEDAVAGRLAVGRHLREVPGDEHGRPARRRCGVAVTRK